MVQELNNNGVLVIAVGLTRNTNKQDLISMSNAGSDYLRFTGGYFDIQNRVGDVERLLCAIRPKGTQPSDGYERTIRISLIIIILIIIIIRHS